MCVYLLLNGPECVHTENTFFKTIFFSSRVLFSFIFCYRHKMKRPKYTHHTTKELLPTSARYSIVLQNAATFFLRSRNTIKKKLSVKLSFKKSVLLFGYIFAHSHSVKINLLPISREIISYYIFIECMLYFIITFVFFVFFLVLSLSLKSLFRCRQ